MLGKLAADSEMELRSSRNKKCARGRKNGVGGYRAMGAGNKGEMLERGKSSIGVWWGQIKATLSGAVC